MRSGSSNASQGCGVSLTQVQRQTPEAYRQAIEALREDAARFALLEQLGAVREVAWADSVAVGGRGVAGGAGPPKRARPAELRIGGLCDPRRHRAGNRRDSGRATARGRAGRELLAWTSTCRCTTPWHRRLTLGSSTRDRCSSFMPTRRKYIAMRRWNGAGEPLVARTEAGEEHVVTATQAPAFDGYERRPIEMAPRGISSC